MESPNTNFQTETDCSTQLSEVLFKEINLNKTRDDYSFPIKAIGNVGEQSKAKGTKIKMETLLYNLNKVINKSDIARVDYCKGGYKPNLENGLEPLNELFSDNILVYCPIPDNLVESFKDTLKTEEDEEEDKGIIKITNRSLIKIAEPLLASFTGKIKGIFNLCGIQINKPDIKPIAVVACKDSFIHKPSKYVQVLKVNMSCASITDVFNLITEHSKTLQDNDIFIHDIDFTRDYKGLFNKTELVDHLINNCGFRKENTYGNSDTTILANSNTVSKNCLTFIKTVPGNGTIRYKFYNKFVQSMESPSVRNRVGSHINDWCNNPELELNRAINDSLETGLLRLEITFYRYDTDKPLTKEFVTEQMDYLENLVSRNNNDVIYYNSIENQFNNLCNNVLYNICLLDVDSKMAFVSLYHNSLTGKTNGFYIKETTSTKLSNALRYYTGKKPIIVILIQQDKNNGIISIQQDTYIKINPSGEDITTYLTKGSQYLHGIAIKDKITAKQPKDVGLIPNSTFNFVIPDKVASLLRSPNKNTCPYMFKNIPFSLLEYPNETLTIRSVNKVIKEEATAEQFAEDNKDKLEEIKAKNKEIAEELAKQQEEIAEEIALQKYIESNKNKLYTILKSIRSNTRRMLDLENNTILRIYGFKETNTKYGKTYLLAASTDATLDDNTELDLYWSTTSIINYIEKVKTCYKKLDIHGIVAYGSLTGKPILTVKKVGEYTSQTKNKCAAMEIVQRRSNTKEDTSLLDKNLKLDTELEEVPDYVGVRGKPKLDSVVKEGDTVTIIGYRETKASMLIKASIGGGIQEIPQYYIATYWLKEIINKHILENKNKFTVLVGPDKTAPNKHKFKTYIYK